MPARAAARARGERLAAAAAAAAAAATEATVEPGGGACQSPMFLKKAKTFKCRSCFRGLWLGGRAVERVEKGREGGLGRVHVGFCSMQRFFGSDGRKTKVTNQRCPPAHRPTAASAPPSSQLKSAVKATCGSVGACVGGRGWEGKKRTPLAATSQRANAETKKNVCRALPLLGPAFHARCQHLLCAVCRTCVRWRRGRGRVDAGREGGKAAGASAQAWGVWGPTRGEKGQKRRCRGRGSDRTLGLSRCGGKGAEQHRAQGPKSEKK